MFIAKVISALPGATSPPASTANRLKNRRSMGSVPIPIAIYERTKAEIDEARKTMAEDAFLSLWEGRNDRLRNLGIKLVPLE